MKTNIIRIGNSQGIRIPKILLEQSQLGTEVELEVEDRKIVIRSATCARQGWGDQFKVMAENGDDQMLVAEASPPTEWDRDEWEW